MKLHLAHLKVGGNQKILSPTFLKAPFGAFLLKLV